MLKPIVQQIHGVNSLVLHLDLNLIYHLKRYMKPVPIRVHKSTMRRAQQIPWMNGKYQLKDLVQFDAIGRQE